jgi:hypothetical protein
MCSVTDPQDWIAHGPPFGSPSGLALSMPVCMQFFPLASGLTALPRAHLCMQIFPLASGLTALPRAHHAPASSARPSDHLSVIHRARVEHDRVQCHRPFTPLFSLPWRFETCLGPGRPYSSPWSRPSQCACRSFRLPLGSLLSLGLTMHLQALLARQITFR